MSEERIPAEVILPYVDRWVAEGGSVYAELGDSMAHWIARLRSGTMRGLTIDQADRLLCRLELPGVLDRIAPPPKMRGGYTWPKPHPLRKITTAQARAAWVCHYDGGLSLRELGRQLWERFGYASPHSCAVALEQAWKREGWPIRSRLEAVRLENARRGYVTGRDRNTYRRQRRAQLRSSDPAFRAEEQARLERLHQSERRSA